MAATYPDPNLPPVEFTTVLFSDVVDAIDKDRPKELAKPAIDYEFGGGRVIKRGRNIDPYQDA